MLRSRVLALSCSSRIFHNFIYYWFKIFLFKYSDFINTVCCCHLSALLFRQVCNLCFLPLVPPGVLVPVLLPPADHPLRHHPHLLRLQALHDPEVVEDGPSVRAHPLLYLPLGVRAVPAVHNVVEVVHNLTRAGADIHQARIEYRRKRAKAGLNTSFLRKCSLSVGFLHSGQFWRWDSRSPLSGLSAQLSTLFADIGDFGRQFWEQTQC